jgi:O-6-methylguanine DNA methyltransferase
VLATVRRIPVGAVATYGDIAEWAGAPRAARAVGSILRGCDDPAVPCHRVVAAGGALGGFGSWLHVKRDRLIAEGLEVSPARVLAFAAVRWSGESSEGRAVRRATPRRPRPV